MELSKRDDPVIDNPLLHVSNPELVIVLDDKASVLVIVFDVKAPVLVIVLDVNVFKVDGPKTFNDDVSILSDCCVFVSNVFY